MFNRTVDSRGNLILRSVGLQVSTRQPAVARRSAKVSCSAEQRPVQAVSKVMGAGLLAAAISLGSVQSAHAEDLFYSDANISGLTKCSENKGFAKRQKSEIKALQKRLAKVTLTVRAVPASNIPNG